MFTIKMRQQKRFSGLTIIYVLQKLWSNNNIYKLQKLFRKQLCLDPDFKISIAKPEK